MAETDIKTLVPRVRRAVQGVTPDMSVTAEMLKFVVADSLSAILLYTGSVFGHQLTVTERDGEGVPQEYATSDELTLAEQEVVARQAALDYFFHVFSTTKTSETIADEAQSWTYSQSAQAIRDQWAYLIAERDKALEALGGAGALDSYVSFLAVRDEAVARAVEPWTEGFGGMGGLETDFRFGTVG